MICPNCGQTIPDGLPSCPACGAPVGAPQQPYGAPQQPYGAPQGGYGAPAAGGAPIDFNGFMNRAKSNPILFAVPVAFVLTFIFSLVKSFVTADLGWLGKHGKTIFADAALFGILVLLIDAWACLVELHSGSQTGFGGVIAKYKSLPFSQFYAGGAHVLLILIGGLIAKGKLKDQLMGLIKPGLGLSFFMLLITGVIIMLPAIMRTVKHQPPYDV